MSATFGVTCLQPVTPGSSADSLRSGAGKAGAQPIIKSCTYDPDTQQPCTEADATLWEREAERAKAKLAPEATDASTTNGLAGEQGKLKTVHGVTLFFSE